MIEGNLAAEGDYNWLNKMKGIGYKIILYFLCTDSIITHKQRVAERVAQGGHNVPDAIIEHRYHAALTS